MSSFALPILEARSRAGERMLKRLVARGEEVLDPKLKRRAAAIVDEVRRGGDRALLRLVARHDGYRARSVAALQLPHTPTAAVAALLPPGFDDALERTLAAVERFHRPQAAITGYRLEEGGMLLEQRRTPLRRVGVYVPGGRASYPSTLAMTVLPARLAGVEEVVVVTPRKAWEASPALRYTLARLGVEEAWGMGGAHAVAALAYGTETIPAVEKIVGPGNAWVTAAKHLVSDRVGIDGLAGPTEVVVVASAGSDPALIAADLLAQAEHDPRAAAVLVTDDKGLAKAVRGELAKQLRELPRESAAGESMRRFGVALLVRDLEEAAEVADRIAPEHLQLVGEAAEGLAERDFTTGALFVGAGTPEVLGDYVAGPSHVLPTCGAARFTSALGVEDFVRRWHRVQCTPSASSRWAAAAMTWALAEGLPAHAASAQRRLR